MRSDPSRQEYAVEASPRPERLAVAKSRSEHGRESDAVLAMYDSSSICNPIYSICNIVSYSYLLIGVGEKPEYICTYSNVISISILIVIEVTVIYL